MCIRFVNADFKTADAGEEGQVPHRFFTSAQNIAPNTRAVWHALRRAYSSDRFRPRTCPLTCAHVAGFLGGFTVALIPSNSLFTTSVRSQFAVVETSLLILVRSGDQSCAVKFAPSASCSVRWCSTCTRRF